MSMLARFVGMLSRKGPIAFVGVGAAATAASNVIDVPAGVREGDLLIICGASGSSHTLTNATGWELLTPAGSGATRPHMWWKIAGAAEADNSVTSTQSRMRFVMLAYRFANASNPKDVAGTVANSNDSTAEVTSLTTTAANDLIVGFSCSTDTDTTTAPASTNERYNVAGDGSINGVCVFDEIQAAVGATTSRVVNYSGSAAWFTYGASFKP